MPKRCRRVFLQQEVPRPREPVSYWYPQQREPRVPCDECYDYCNQSQRRPRRMQSPIVAIRMLLNIKGEELIIVTKFSCVHYSILARDTVQRNSPNGKPSVNIHSPDLEIHRSVVPIWLIPNSFRIRPFRGNDLACQPTFNVGVDHKTRRKSL